MCSDLFFPSAEERCCSGPVDSSRPAREFPRYQPGPPQDYLDLLSQQRRLEEVSAPLTCLLLSILMHCFLYGITVGLCVIRSLFYASRMFLLYHRIVFIACSVCLFLFCYLERLVPCTEALMKITLAVTCSL